MDELKQRKDESAFEWKLRLCKAKINKEIDADWIEIVNVLGLDISSDQFRKVAKGYVEYDDYIHGINNVATSILSVSDFHVPFQLPYEKLKDYRGIDILELNGDIVDCQSLSKFDKTYRISSMEEIIKGRQYLIDMIGYLHPKKVVCINGNHDYRFKNYLAKHLDTDAINLLPNSSLELIFVDGFYNYDKRTKAKTWYEPICNIFKDLKIEYLDDWKVKIGKTWFVHPLAYRQGYLATAERAKDYFQDTDKGAIDCIVMAHTHMIGDTKRGYVRLLEQGAFAEVEKMDYLDGRLTKPQKEGFAIICQDKDGNLIESRTKVVVLN